MVWIETVSRSTALAAFALMVFHGSTAVALPLLPRPQPGQPLGADQLVPRGSELDDGGRNLDAHDAARQAQDLNGGGRVLSVEEARGGWRVKLLKEGNVRIVFVPD